MVAPEPSSRLSVSLPVRRRSPSCPSLRRNASPSSTRLSSLAFGERCLSKPRRAAPVNLRAIGAGRFALASLVGDRRLRNKASLAAVQRDIVWFGEINRLAVQRDIVGFGVRGRLVVLMSPRLLRTLNCGSTGCWMASSAGRDKSFFLLRSTVGRVQL